MIFLTDIVDLWHVFDEWSEAHVLAAAAENNGIYVDVGDMWSAKMPFDPRLNAWGFNTGVVLFHLQRLRQLEYTRLLREEVTRVMQRFAVHAQPPLMPRKLMWSDQDLLNVWSIARPESVFLLPCQWNFQVSRLLSNRRGQCSHQRLLAVHGNANTFLFQQRGEIAPSHWEDYRKAVAALDSVYFQQQLPHDAAHVRLVASSSRDWSHEQLAGGWRYGFVRRSGDGQDASALDEDLFTLFPAWKQTFFAHTGDNRLTPDVPDDEDFNHVTYPYRYHLWTTTRRPDQFDTACNAYLDLDVCQHTFDIELSELRHTALSAYVPRRMSEEAYPIHSTQASFQAVNEAQALSFWEPRLFARVAAFGLSELIGIGRFSQSSSLFYSSVRRWQSEEDFERVHVTLEVHGGLVRHGNYALFDSVPLCEDTVECQLSIRRRAPTEARPELEILFSGQFSISNDQDDHRRSFEHLEAFQVNSLRKGDLIDFTLRSVKQDQSCQQLRLPVRISLDISESIKN